MRILFTRSLFVLALIAASTKVNAQVSLPTINAPSNENFNTVASSGTTNDVSTLPQGWLFLETGTNGNTTYAAGTGSSNAGNTYSFGINAADRALGGLQSGSLIPAIGASFTNNTGTAITSLEIHYTGEQWRLGATSRGADRLDFQYSLTATALNNGAWLDIDELDFTSPVVSGTVGALVGNDTLNSDNVFYTIEGLNIPDGATFFIRWLDFNVSGADDGLAVDDFIIIPKGGISNEPSINFTPPVLNFGVVPLETTSVKSYTIRGTNLSDSIIAQAPAGSSLQLSIDGILFQDRVTVPDSGGVVYARFAPTTAGTLADSILHSSDSTISWLAVSGTALDPASVVISIAEARTKSTGTFVSVAGRITVGNEHGNPAYLQDGTGGIPVFDFNLANAVEIGDSVSVYGPIGLFNDQKQISGSGIVFKKFNTPKRFIAPKPIAISELAANEGLLVTVQGVEMVNKNFVFYPQSTEQIIAGGIQADLRIDGDTDLPGLSKPQGVVDITGVVGRFRTNAQLLPRFREDVPGVSEPTTPQDSVPRGATFDVVNWNFEFFGARSEDYGNEEFGPADEALQLANVKKVLDSLRADIYAVQEISNDSLFQQLVLQLPGYNYRCSDRYSYSFNGPDDEFPPQKVCFIYDTATVRVLSDRAMFESLYDSARTIDPSLLPGIPDNDPSSFWSSGRLPYILTVAATIDGVTETIRLIDIHSKSGAAAADRNRRAYDAAVLKDSLDAHFGDDKVILLGDYNDDLDVSISAGATTPYLAFVTDSARYLPVTKALSEAGAKSTISFNDMIDHQIITNELAGVFLNGSERVITPFSLIPNYAETTSDHLPVLTRFRFEAPEVNFVKTTFTVSESNTSVYTANFTLSRPLTNATTIIVNLEGTATAGKDFVTTPAASGDSLFLNLATGAVEGSFTFKIVNDVADEIDEQIVFSFTDQPGIKAGANAAYSVTVQDNDIPTVGFGEFSVSREEGSGPYTVILPLSVAVATDQTLTVRVTDGLGTNYGSDYVTDPSPVQQLITVPVAAGSTKASYTITPLLDPRPELKYKPVVFTLTGTSPGLQMRWERVFIFTIEDVRRQIPVITIFPNPTRGVVRLISDCDDYDGEISIVVRKDDGSVLYSGSGTLAALGDAISSRLEHARRGIYTVQLLVEGQASVIRLVKI